MIFHCAFYILQVDLESIGTIDGGVWWHTNRKEEVIWKEKEEELLIFFKVTKREVYILYFIIIMLEQLLLEKCAVYGVSFVLYPFSYHLTVFVSSYKVYGILVTINYFCVYYQEMLQNLLFGIYHKGQQKIAQKKFDIRKKELISCCCQIFLSFLALSS